MKPFMNWIGGKRLLLKHISKYYPDKINKYAEPFIGGGAVLLDILEKHHPQEVYISDINKDLCQIWLQLKENAADFIHNLKALREIYLPLDLKDRKEFYINLKEQFNVTSPDDVTERAVLFFFLVQTCFNCKIEYDKLGNFKSCPGKIYSNYVFNEDLLWKAHELLQNVTIVHGEYTLCKDFVDSDTFVYFDPPYRPIKKAGFKGYTTINFTDDDQIKLKEFYAELDKTGAKLLMSNSDPKNTNPDDNFFDELYKEFNIERITITRMLTNKKGYKDRITELLISNQ